MNRIGQQRARPALKTRSGIKNYIGKWKDERTSLGGRAASSGEIVRVKTICEHQILFVSKKLLLTSSHSTAARPPLMVGAPGSGSKPLCGRPRRSRRSATATRV